MKETDKNSDRISEEYSSPMRQYAVYSTVVFQMLATIGIGFWGGKKLSDYLELETNLLTVGIGLAFMALAMYNLLKSLERINSKSKK